ncbi:MAG: helix-turn-helix domain-containing protein [Clostridia bacterium]|nr:helix-turn-helix domain-containing protein [Clostridia bacterium]
MSGGYLTEAGYAGESRKNGGLTPAAEDYLEMIYRISVEEGERRPVRICELSEKLHVSPSSASRMAQSMAVWGYLDFKRYGYITMTEKGWSMGEYLVHRHGTVMRFLEWLTGKSELTETERIEHYLSRGTVEAMERLLQREAERNEATDEETVIS